MNKRRLLCMVILLAAAACADAAAADHGKPLYHCEGLIASPHRHVPFTIEASSWDGWAEPVTMDRKDGSLLISPRTLLLDPAHPSARMTVSEPDYTGPFYLELADCPMIPDRVGRLDVRFSPADARGPKVEATFILSDVKK